MVSKLQNLSDGLHLWNNSFIRIINGGLIMLFPVIITGAFALVLKTLPIPGYLSFINNFFGGIIYNVLDLVHEGTFGMLAAYMTITITISFQRETSFPSSLRFSEILTSLACFVILSGVFERNFRIDYLGVKGMVTAIISGIFSSFVFSYINNLFKRCRKLFPSGADVGFNRAISVIPDACITLVIFTVVSKIIVMSSGATSFQQLITKGVTLLFSNMHTDFLSGLLFVVINSFLWFFGIHGSDCLQEVSTRLFTPGLTQNATSVMNGFAPQTILTKQFFDVFVLMGGCGTGVCLFIALIIFGKRRSDKSIARLSAAPIIFNINEILLFGIPVILNPILFIPFILTPVVCYITSFFAMKLGLVSLTMSYVDWTTPVLFGGYLATGSISGTLLQAFNILLGVFIYAPFIKKLDEEKINLSKNNYGKLVNFYKGYEEGGKQLHLIEIENDLGDTAKMLGDDLKELICSGNINLYFQPQITSEGKCFGVEALLRWNHPLYGMIYPPLAIKIADEIGLLPQFEKEIISIAETKFSFLKSELSNDIMLSVNISDKTLRSEGFTQYLSDTIKSDEKICLEITEQTALQFDDELSMIFYKIKEAGVKLAIDDFSMGQTSISYLKDKNFDLIKLDGSLVRPIVENSRCLEIVSSIVSLSKKLGVDVLAEYVENEKIRQKLYDIGCNIYQGYLFAPAMKPQELKGALEKSMKHNEKVLTR